MQDSSTLEPAGNSSVQVQVDMARGESFDDRPISWDEPVKIVWSLGTFAHKVSVKVTKMNTSWAAGVSECKHYVSWTETLSVNKCLSSYV